MCFSAMWWQQLLIWLVIIGAFVAIIRLFLPQVLANFGAPGTLILQALNIIMWAAVLIFAIYLAFDLLSCLGGGLRLPGR